MNAFARPTPAPAPPAPDLAGDLRELRDLLRERREDLFDSRRAEPTAQEIAEEEMRRLQRFVQFLLSLVEELREERDSLLRELDHRGRIDDLHAKYEELAAFAATIRRDVEEVRRPARRPPVRRAAPAPEPIDERDEDEREETRRDASPPRPRPQLGPRAARGIHERYAYPSIRRA